MSQEPTVLVRIYGKTRDTIDALRKAKWGDFGPKESFAAAIERMVQTDAGGAVPKEKKKPAGKRSRRRRRGSSKGKRKRARR